MCFLYVFVVVVVVVVVLQTMRIISSTVVPTKSDADVIFCLQLLSKTFTCTLNLS